MSNRYMLTKEAIQYMCGLIRDLASVSEAIDNTNLADDKVFSNLYTKKLIDKCLEDANTESQKLVGALTHLTCEETTVQPTLDNSSINVIYLYSATGNAPYQQYLKISDTKLIDLGSTSVSLSAYLTATEIARDYVTKLEFDALKTEVKGKVDKTSILTTIDNLATDDQVYSASIVNSELDNKVNKTDITTTIDSNSTGNQVASAKTVYDEIKIGKIVNEDDVNTYGTEIAKFPLGKWIIGSFAINNLTDLPNTYVRYVEIIGKTEASSPWKVVHGIRSYKATSYKGDIFVRSLSSGTEVGVLNLDTGWQRVLLNGDIIDNLTSTDTNKLLSANQGKILNDTKLNKTDANKLNCVVIDNVSLKEYILTNFIVAEGKTYHLIANATCTDLPKASNFYITVETPGLYTYKVTAKELNDSNGRYVCTYRTLSSSWTAWEKVCTTTVADVPFTPITFKDSNIVNLGNSGYCVNNGWCHLVLEIQFNADMTFGWDGITSCNIPIPKTIQRTTKMILNSTTVPVKSIICGLQGELVLFGFASNTEQYFGSVSYPVAE